MGVTGAMVDVDLNACVWSLCVSVCDRIVRGTWVCVWRRPMHSYRGANKTTTHKRKKKTLR